ncbi:alpha/beta fold hydrolase [Dyadobacter sp. CY343]|uniref:alpha/beta fold hydrolase n=1 Tax=Dyadobacter sp. CY343 TaxID=2907299 RepID=UPI001F1AC066|nr:alpha/beta fold hydrolase [Dyadobacter sp. CY343]MCE7060216.1 alpha/beta fold hydrolase [Dyadobacter sp. CY343]
MKTLISKLIGSLLIMCIFITGCDGDDEVQSAPSKTYVLVHGAFQGAYAWQYVKAQLEKKGHKVVAVELPAHGEDKTPPADISLNVYRDKVVGAISGLSGKVILVGHSMGGMVITATAEKIPDKIEKLIYIAAFIPANGQSLLDLASTDSTSKLFPALIPSADGLTQDIKPENIVPIFAQDANEEVKKLLLDKRRAEPSKIFPDKATVTAANWAKVDKYYIFTKRDNTVGPGLQKRMVAAAKITKTTTIDSDHSPFLTKPDVITELLMANN